ncbi:hypothetical protein OG884_11620 [Streptosporangium sp. NBC_01755]|uniref:hypothetical protein n=1 Tax=Streptosporangium sp. NBC_01755 TaxID=2975949 RepID=UPI002DD7F9E1|nr:hypothetical protein [Streptosporangium sp. NBC_01755]WSD02516.1 hypothetical protein OG884_11620 [Streptosporangium sp. NBC_01755]
MRTGTMSRRMVVVPSAGRTLAVAACDDVIVAWPHIAPHVPGASAELLQPGEHLAARAVAVPDAPPDARRVINAHLHVLHLADGTLCVHAVAMHRPGHGAVLLLGGHGAGKTLAGLALAERGWQWLAGDVTLLDVAADGGSFVRGGTTAILGRRGAVRRWFPDLDLPEAGPVVVDLRRSDTSAAGPGRVPVVAAVLVCLDADPSAAGGVLERVDRHTAATAWLRGSGHLLDRLLDAGEQPLRLLEDEHAQRRRIRYVPP